MNLEVGKTVQLLIVFAADNWLRELRLWCPKLKVLLYYGSQDERREMRYQVLEGKADFNVVVTS